MTEKTLYIIGNGFELYHGQKSKYLDFKKHLKDTNPELLNSLEEYFDAPNLWSDFEENLEYLDTEKIVDRCIKYLEPYSADDWEESYNYIFQQEINKIINLLTSDLKKSFTKWIINLKLPPDAIEKKIQIKDNSVFMNFNYTDTLEKIYNIQNRKIFYIHNKVVDNNSTLILGHSRVPKEKKTVNESKVVEDNDIRVIEGNQILDSFFKETYKSIEIIIAENIEYFNSLSEITEIYVLGHSLSVVDIKYFEEIVKKINIKDAKWIISYFNNKDLYHHKKVMIKLGIVPENCQFVRLNQLKTLQNQFVL